MKRSRKSGNGAITTLGVMRAKKARTLLALCNGGRVGAVFATHPSADFGNPRAGTLLMQDTKRSGLICHSELSSGRSSPMSFSAHSPGYRRERCGGRPSEQNPSKDNSQAQGLLERDERKIETLRISGLSLHCSSRRCAVDDQEPTWRSDELQKRSDFRTCKHNAVRTCAIGACPI
jgi:hypothetical protein